MIWASLCAGLLNHIKVQRPVIEQAEIAQIFLNISNIYDFNRESCSASDSFCAHGLSMPRVLSVDWRL